jgi:putative flippase GtrA
VSLYPLRVPPSPITLLDKLTRGNLEKLLRYSAVSVVGVVITQVLLIVLHGILNLGAVAANVLAVTLTTGPAFLLNKRWVWGKAGRSHWRREVLPFWGFTLLGLGMSTLLVWSAQHYSDATLVVMLANIAGFGVVWVAKFYFLDSLIFARDDTDVTAAPAAG